MRCLYREMICKAGEYVDVAIYPVFGKTQTRRKRYKATSEQQQNLNRRNAALKLTRLLNANFCENDYKLELTYRQECLPKDDDECFKVLKNFFRRLKRRMQKIGKELKYVCVTERSKTGRYHHHLVVNGGLTAREISDCWNRGIIRLSALEMSYDDGLSCLAQYMSKGMSAGYKSFSYSRNLVQPVFTERTGRISAREVREISGLTDCPQEFQKLYPEYEYRAAESKWNPENKYYYIYVKMKRRI